jgi:glutamate racemase
MTKIGVFDSGIGGKSVAEKLERLFPDAEILFVNDSKHVPYGSHRPSQIAKLTEEAIQPLIEAKCDAIVIACNTATTNAIGELRKNHPDMHFVGIEPMVKPAAKLTKTHVIGVLATPATLHSHRYRQLKLQWAPRTTVIEPDCRQWADMIERGESERIDIQSTVNELLRWNADVIVLGCTHYHWLKERIERAAGPHVKVLEPSDAIGARLDSLLSTKTALPE